MPRSPDVCYPDIPEIQPEVSSQTSHDLNNFLLVDKTHASRSNQLFVPIGSQNSCKKIRAIPEECYFPLYLLA